MILALQNGYKVREHGALLLLELMRFVFSIIFLLWLLTGHYIKFLAVLKRARAAASSEHDSIVAFLRENQARDLTAKATGAPADVQCAMGASPGNNPALDRKLPAVPGTSPAPRCRLRPDPLPLSQLKEGVRKVPILETGNGIPFLRLGKPQSAGAIAGGAPEGPTAANDGIKAEGSSWKRSSLLRNGRTVRICSLSDLGIAKTMKAQAHARFADPVRAEHQYGAGMAERRQGRPGQARAPAMWRIVQQGRAGREESKEG